MKREHGRGGEEQQGHTPGQIAAVWRGAARQPQKTGKQRGNDQPLPEEMHQCPTKAFDERLRKRVVHFAPPSISSSSLRISARSADEDFLAASACRTSFCAEPPKARSSK